MTKGRIIYTENVKKSLEDFCAENSFNQLVFICDVNTEKHCLPIFGAINNLIVIPAGEVNKEIETYAFIIKNLIHLKANRSTLIINLGGGVVTDIGGFVASTFMRGIKFINIPTTLLGMVDASIGGKTGIDFQLHKNYLGTFALPEIILVDTNFLKTLAAEEFKSGLAEMIKTGIIANALLFNAIKDGIAIEQLISVAAKTKSEITERDLYDQGERQLLNFGHTIGHAYETYRLNIEQPIKHGFAISKGMMAETRLAFALGMINEDELNTIIDFIAIHTQQKELSSEDIMAISPLLSMDKKNSQHGIVFSLPTGIGKGKAKVGIMLNEIQKILLHA
jgi:3-dehydroquinate synthase